MASSEQTSTLEVRRRRVLEAALAEFGRFGFRKTSMDQVARAAGVSRQGLYLHFADKEDLFRAAVRHDLDFGLAEALERLADPAAPLHTKLLAAFDAWIGRHVGVVGADVSDLDPASQRLVLGIFEDVDKRFRDAVTKALRRSASPKTLEGAGVSARELAEMLSATAHGTKLAVESRSAFRDRLSVAVRLVCWSVCGTR